MKIKTILITAVLVIGAGTATSYFVRRSHESSIVKVEVVPVTSVNNAAYSMGDSSTVSGTIISKDTQVVALDSSHELKNVYVQQGDRVKKGDKLLEYDMLGDELKEEMEELTKMGLELTLESMKKDLETLKSGRMPESMGGGESGYSTSMDSDDDDDGADEDDGDDDAGSAANVDASGRSHVNAGVTKQGGGAVGAADTLAQKPLTLAGAYSKPAAKLTVKPSAKQTQKPAGKLPSTPVWTPSAFLHALQQLQEDIQEQVGKTPDKDEENTDTPDTSAKNPESTDAAANTTNTANTPDANAANIPDANTANTPDLNPDLPDGSTGTTTIPSVTAGIEDDEIIADDSTDFVVSSWDDLSSGSGETVDAPVTASELFAGVPEESVPNTVPDAIDAEGVTGLFGDEYVEDDTTIQDGIFDEEGNAADVPALASAIVDADAEDAASGPAAAIEAEDDTAAAALTAQEPEETIPEQVSAMEDIPVPDEGTDTTGSGEENDSGQPSGTGSGEANGSGQAPGTDSGDTSSANPSGPFLETNFEGDVLIADDDEMTLENPLDTIAEINQFLSQVNEITLAIEGDWNTISTQLTAINAGIEKFRNSFAQSSQHETTDLFGENVIVTAYSVKPEIVSQVGTATAAVMQTAYEKLCAYHFIQTMLALNPNSEGSLFADPTWASANEAAVKAAVSELANLPQNIWLYNPATNSIEFRDLIPGINMNQAIFDGQSIVDFLRGAALKVNENYVLEEPTNINPEISTEGKIWTTPAPSGDDGDDGLGYTAEELAEAIKEQEKNIKETELQIREAELGIKEHKKILEGKIVYATMDGIVKSAGTLESASGNSFITITGKAGLYVKGSVNELALDTVKVGNTITGTSYETGSTFTAEIVEISEYPEDSSNNFYGYGDGNTNSSYYPFLAYIENADGLEVDSYVDLSLSGSSASSYSDPMLSDGLSLEEYFIRTDNNGRSYCFVRGEDGLLEKRYLEVGANNWGTITIKSGLTPRDCIAFPYGDGVEEGAQTVEVEYLTAVEGEDF